MTSAVRGLTAQLAPWIADGSNDEEENPIPVVALRPKTLFEAFSTARRSCGLAQVRFHDLRHFALTMAAATGATTKELMARAGHSTAAATLRHQHATEDRDRAIAEALEQFVTGDVVGIDSGRGRDHLAR